MMKTSFYIALVIAFIDLMGVGMIYPLYSSIIFDSSSNLLPVDASAEMRGLYFGILIALTPLMSFFSAPIWGALSDHRGRKMPLLITQTISLIGYVIGLGGVAVQNIHLLFFSRAVIGIASGNMSIVQATVADLSTPEQKTKNFGLYSMALGTGFTFGPLMSGLLLPIGYTYPFWAAIVIVATNLILTYTLFQETLLKRIARSISWKNGFLQLKKVYEMRGIRALIIATFLHNFAWSYFFEFSPIYLIKNLDFSPSALGFFYAMMGAVYALSTGLLIRPFITRFKAITLFFAGNLLTAIMLFTLPFTGLGIWGFLIPLCFFISFVTPTSQALVSTHASAQIQGEALGILSSANAAALVLSPLFAASFVGAHPVWVFWISSGGMLLAAALVLVIYGKRLAGN